MSVTATEKPVEGGGTNIVQTDLAFGEGEALRVEDVMRVLHISRNTVYKLAREGALPSFRVGRQMRFRYDDVRVRLEGSASGASATRRETPDAPVSGRELDPSPANDAACELPAWARDSLIVGGQDVMGDVLCNYLGGLGVSTLHAHVTPYLALTRMYLGSCHAATLSLWSERDGAFNAPYIRTFLPGVPAVAFRLCKHQVGLTVPAGNPAGLMGWADLLGTSVVVANRECGSSPRILLDEKLKGLEARPDAVAGYAKPVNSELSQALMVARGLATCAVTSAKPATQVKGLSFVPLQDATVDLVVLRTERTAPFIRAAQSLLRTEAFRREFDRDLYDVRLMGEVVYEC